MVKGVNKTVIEVNDTGSKVFEKVVLYVSPKYTNLTAKQLKKAAESLNINYGEKNGIYKPLREKWYRRKVAVVLASFGLCLLLAVSAYFVFF